MSPEETAAPQRHCPSCGNRGRIVEPITLQSLLKPDRLGFVGGAVYRYCGRRGCEVVYFAEDNSRVFTLGDLTVRVGAKVFDPPRPLCYCFGYTAEDLLEEIRNTGRTTIPDKIRAGIGSDACRCERTNPQGSCCLGVVTAFVDEARQAGEGGTGGDGEVLSQQRSQPGDDA